MHLNQKKEIIILNVDNPFEVEITGSPKAKTAIVFVHGFGVNRQSRGLFVEIESSLPESILSVRADYSQVLKERCIALPFKAQCQRLDALISYIQGHYSIEKFIYIGHSQGCITLGLYQPQQALILLLAPPIISPFEEFINTSGWKKPGSYLNLTGNSRLVRSDLIVEVPLEFWQEFKTIDAHYLYQNLAIQNEVKIIVAENDQILGKQPDIANITTYTIPDANHDFSGIQWKNFPKCSFW
ncbi:MAG: hypothetical protein H0U73_08005 [Tatlockia sp.]|nr:hypothetical protein [Tatlockia sp.]